MKRMGVLAAIGAALAMTMAAPAAAQESEGTTELRCILLSGHMASVTDPKARQAGMMMAFYFLGRLDKKYSAAELEKRLSAEAAEITSDKLKAAATTCGDQLSARGRFLEDLGKKLSASKPAAPAAEKPAAKPAPTDD